MDKQSEIIEELKAKLAQVSSFGASVFEDSVMRVLDSKDVLPTDFIVLQQGATSEVQRSGADSLREQMVVNITLVTSKRDYAAAFRAARYEIKKIFAGRTIKLTASSGQTSGFLQEDTLHPEPGRALAVHVMPLEIGYVQPYQ